jgi:predicted TIM-barrel enzyme
MIEFPSDMLTDFGGRRVVLPVVHVRDASQSLRNVEMAYRNRCNGVFLIGHDLSADYVLDVAKQVKDAFPNFWLGVNLLDLSPEQALERLERAKKQDIHIEGLWCDDVGIEEDVDNGRIFGDGAYDIAQLRAEINWEGLLFGGVAFKYQKPVRNYKAAAEMARNYIDIITTSGDATASPPDPQKIKIMANAVYPKSLAIASGLDAENVRLFPDCRIFMVSSSISHSFYEFNEKELDEFVAATAAMGMWRQPTVELPW